MKWRQPADRRFVQAILQVFRGDRDRAYAQLSTLPERAWERSAYWLYTSGLPFYLLDRLRELGIADALPRKTLESLHSDLHRNEVRTKAMFGEFQQLNAAFQAAGIVYVNHKGFTLCPHACPWPALRHQTDFDFIIARADLERARECLVARGYVLSAAAAKTWEFKAGEYLRRKWDGYSMGTYRAVELHFGIWPNSSGSDPRLLRRTAWCWGGTQYPALASADQLIAQALHLFSHIRNEYTRPAWLLEFRRHVITRQEDSAFWASVRRLAGAGSSTGIALGVSILIASQLFGKFAPADIQDWAVASVPPTVRAWTEQYGVSSVIADFPGTKLFLLLEQELDRLMMRQSVVVRERLLPVRRVRRVFATRADETQLERWRRRAVQLRFVLFRARFHIVEATRYVLELPRWHAVVARPEPIPACVQTPHGK